MKIKNGEFLKGDCLELMAGIPDGSVDCILCDLPFEVLGHQWDEIIPFDKLWEQYNRITKPNAPIVLFGTQPFTTKLINSQIDKFKYTWTWNKGKGGSFAIAKLQPMRVTEDIVVFCKGKPSYYPQMEIADDKNKRPRNRVDIAPESKSYKLDQYKPSETRDENLRYPKNIINIKSTEGECNNANRIHPTQKPVELFSYLIETYTNPGELVLDNTAGSGTLAIAAENTGRKWICIEKDDNYFEKATKRVIDHIIPINHIEESLFE